MLTKRLFDILCAATGLLLLLPLFLLIAIWIRIDSPGPVFFRQERVGRFGSLFRIVKFRTMQADTQGERAQITVGKDPRITRAGHLLRHYKLDELPQLLNVLTGEMSLVGPRPEVPRYVALYPPDIRTTVLSVPPGMTDYASIAFRNENALLAEANDPVQTYIESIMPKKLRYCQQYVAERSFMVDIKIIVLTILALFD